MFHSSTQRQHWVFRSEEELDKLRRAANGAYCEKHARAAADKGCQMLTSDEEKLVCQYYMKKLLEFCNVFEPRVPRSAVAVASTYFKRFYLNTSVMAYNPRDMFFCCVYLAFKIDEYIVSMDQFGDTITPDLRPAVVDYIISHELLLLKRLKFHLTIHTPFRPLEGFVIDIKTRAPEIPCPDLLRSAAESFLERSLASDTCLLFPPSQIALAALRHAAKHALKQSDRQILFSIDRYIVSVLFKTEPPEIAKSVMEALNKIEAIVSKVVLPEGEKVKPIEKKLEKCRVQELSPKSNRKRKSEEVTGAAGKKLKLEDPSELPLPGISRLS